MKLSQTFKIQALVIFLALTGAMSGFADNLIYAGKQDQKSGNSGLQDGESNLVPMNYGTNYDAQFSPYSSFMQSPYSNGQLQQQYPGAPPPGNPAMANSQDPYMASEVSPYSRYSPYIEVVGEGSNYTLGIDDVITVIVRDQPDFSGRYVVDPDGNIQYNFVGDIKAEGRTKEELKAEIVKRLQKFVRYPEVAVMISEYRSKAVYVFGFVNHPGKFAMKGDKITLQEAIVAAGLPRMDGALKRVYVVRPSKFTDDGNSKQKKVNLEKLLQKGDSAEDFILLPGDTIIVNQRYFDKFVNGFSRVVGPLFQAASVYELGFGNQNGGFLRKNKS